MVVPVGRLWFTWPRLEVEASGRGYVCGGEMGGGRGRSLSARRGWS